MSDTDVVETCLLTLVLSNKSWHSTDKTQWVGGPGAVNMNPCASWWKGQPILSKMWVMGLHAVPPVWPGTIDRVSKCYQRKERINYFLVFWIWKTQIAAQVRINFVLHLMLLLRGTKLRVYFVISAVHCICIVWLISYVHTCTQQNHARYYKKPTLI